MESQCSACSEYARVRCYCKETEQIFCLPCLETHLKSGGARHVTRQISEKKDPQCALCKLPMEMLCLCQDSKTRLCHNCVVTHMLSNPTIAHSIEPLVVEALTEDAQDLGKYIEKKKIIDFLIAEARSNYKIITKYKENLIDTRRIIIENLDKTIEEATKKADSLKEALNTIIALLEAKKFAQAPSQDWADEILRKCRTETTQLASKDLKYLIGNINKDPIISALQHLSDLRVIKNPTKNTPTLYFIKPKTQEIFFSDVDSMNFYKLSFPPGLRLKEFGAWCTIATGCLIYCGGQETNNCTSECFQIDLAENSFKKLRDMNEPRAFPALVKFNRFLYAFGGYQGRISLKSSEKFDLENNKWESIGEMANPRSGIVASVSEDKIFIVGDSKNVEMFDTVSESFITINLKLNVCESFTTSLVFNKKYIVLQKDKCFEAGGDLSELSLVKNVPTGSWWSQFSPVVYDKKSYFSRYDDGSLWRFDWSSYELKRLAKF